ncbi:hypothetical protein BJY52DRAFT_1224082 [Lactarius psammicola]|nr:hypothetical protein BJY52DRAFT_1224082 [Lactarius psammicola]
MPIRSESRFGTFILLPWCGSATLQLGFEFTRGAQSAHSDGDPRTLRFLRKPVDVVAELQIQAIEERRERGVRDREVVPDGKLRLATDEGCGDSEGRKDLRPHHVDEESGSQGPTWGSRAPQLDLSRVKIIVARKMHPEI